MDKVQELKNKIERRSIDDSFLVLVYPDTTFLAHHYVDEIAKARHMTKVYIESFNTVPTHNMFGDVEDVLYILHVDRFEADNVNYKNVIVVCSSVEDRTKQMVVESGVCVELPKLQEWQILDYMKSLCPGIDDAQLKWLYDITGGNIYRLHSEISKLSVFEPAEQSDMFNKLNDDGGYSDLSSFNIYSLTNAIMNRDRKTTAEVLAERDGIDIEGVGLITILYKNIKNLIDVQINPKATAESLGMSDKQFKAISYKRNKFSNAELIDMLEFITSLDMRLKSGDLQLSNEKLIDFIVCNVLL